MHPSDSTEFQQAASPAAEDFEKAQTLFNAGDFQQSYQAAIAGLKKDAGHQPLYSLAADAAGRTGAYSVQEHFDRAGNNMDDAEAFYELGEFFFGEYTYDLAEVFYEKTLDLDPEYPSAVHDLILSRARQFRIADAVAGFGLLRANTLDFWESYMLCKMGILSADEEGMALLKSGWLDNLEAEVKNHISDPESLALCMVKIAELREGIERFAVVPNVQTHIRDWQFIQYGGAVLDFHDDGEDYLAGGRYAICWGTHTRIKSLADKLKQFVQRLEIPLQGVAALDDRDSEIVGRVLAKALDLPFAAYDPYGDNQGCLIVTSESANLNYTDYEGLSGIKNGQIVFALNHNWLRPAKVTPDIIGQMSQEYHFPWNGGGLQIFPGAAEGIKVTSRDDRPAEAIAAEIFQLEVPTADIGALLDFYAEHKAYLKGIGTLGQSTRFEFNIESPVPGTFF